MTEIYLVRHGQASFNAEIYDNLSDLGRQQSDYLGQYFTERNIKFDRLITGTQQRHHQTAQAILSDHQKPDHDIQEGLNEYDFTALYKAFMAQHPTEEIKPKAEDRRIYYRRLKKALKLWSMGELHGELPESWLDFKKRVSDAMDHIRNISTETSLIVSSGGVISMMVGQMLDLDPDHIINLNLQIRNTSFSKVYPGRNALHLASFNNIPHLDQPERMTTITYS